MDKQMLGVYAARESLPVEVLLDLLFGKQLDELEQERIAYHFYPTMRTSKSRKDVPLYEQFTKWLIALVHPSPNKSAKLSDILEAQVRLPDFLSWYKECPSKFSFSTNAKQFFKNLEKNQNMAKPVESGGKRRNPVKSKSDHQKSETQKRYNRWKKEYSKMKKKHPHKSGNWIAIQISKMKIAEGRESETIRRKMKG